MKNKVNREIKRSRNIHYDTYFNEHKNDIKKTWEGIRRLVNVKKKDGYGISQLNINGKVIDDPKDIAENINEFFANVGPNTEKTVPIVSHYTPQTFLKNRNQFELIIAHISETEILEIIQLLPNKGSGPASIPLKFLKVVADLIVVPLCHIINVSLETGIFPDVLKVAKVLPRHKGGSTEDLNNFRPISLLSIFDNIFEK